MLAGAVRIGSIRGIDIRIHSSWIVIAILVAWSFLQQFGSLVGHSPGVAMLMALVATVLFFGSVLAHELAHSLEAQHRGVEVGGITLFLFGGVTETRFDVKRPLDEFALTAVGPFTSFVTAAVFGIVAAYANAARLGPVGEVAGALAWINVALGVFNLLPGAPLDGGRILRSAVWWLTGDRDRAVRIAGRTGQLLGGLIAAVGIFLIFFVPTGLFSGIWLAFIGWFLANAAQQEIVQQEARGVLEGRAIGDLLEDLPRGLPPDATVADAAVALARSPLDIVVIREDDQVTGVVHLRDVAPVPEGERLLIPARRLARPVSQLPSVRVDDEILDVIGRLQSAEILAIQDDGGDVVAIATRRQLLQTLTRAVELRGRGGRRGGARRRSHLPGEDAA